MQTYIENYCEIVQFRWRPEIFSRQYTRHFNINLYANYIYTKNTCETCEICHSAKAIAVRMLSFVYATYDINVCAQCKIKLINLKNMTPQIDVVISSLDVYNFYDSAIFKIADRGKFYWRHNLFARDLDVVFVKYRSIFIAIWGPVIDILAQYLTNDIARIIMILIMKL